MRYRFHVYHFEQGKSPLEQATERFDEEDELRAYELLPTYLRLRFSGKANNVTCKTLTDGSPGVIVEITSENDQNTVDADLAKHLVALNYQTKGLCLAIE